MQFLKFSPLSEKEVLVLENEGALYTRGINGDRGYILSDDLLKVKSVSEIWKKFGNVSEEFQTEMISMLKSNNVSVTMEESKNIDFWKKIDGGQNVEIGFTTVDLDLESKPKITKGEDKNKAYRSYHKLSNESYSQYLTFCLLNRDYFSKINFSNGSEFSIFNSRRSVAYQQILKSQDLNPESISKYIFKSYYKAFGLLNDKFFSKLYTVIIGSLKKKEKKILNFYLNNCADFLFIDREDAKLFYPENKKNLFEILKQSCEELNIPLVEPEQAKSSEKFDFVTFFPGSIQASGKTEEAFFNDLNSKMEILLRKNLEIGGSIIFFSPDSSIIERVKEKHEDCYVHRVDSIRDDYILQIRKL